MAKGSSGKGGSGGKGSSSKKSSTKKTSKGTTKVGKVKVSKPKAPKAWTNNVAKPAEYKEIAAPAAFAPGTYTSEYADRISGALDKVTNWSYDPLQDASYQALAKVYNQRGNIAAKNSLADAAALNGGFGTSYAVSAAQQARNQYNQELASMIPDFENAAYNRASNTLSALREADNTAYGRFRDTESDRQWAWSNEYQKWRDLTSDNQWKYGQDYQAYRDEVGDSQWSWTNNYNKWRDLMSDYQWGMNWNLDYQKYEESKAASSGGGGGGGGGGGRRGGGGYSSGYSSGGSSGAPTLPDATKYGKVHLWDKKNKVISDKKKAVPIKTYTGKAR